MSYKLTVQIAKLQTWHSRGYVGYKPTSRPTSLRFAKRGLAGINFSLSLFFLEKSNQKPWKLYVNVSSLRSVQGNFPQRLGPKGKPRTGNAHITHAYASHCPPLLLGGLRKRELPLVGSGAKPFGGSLDVGGFGPGWKGH